MMRILPMALVLLAGCQGTVGPIQRDLAPPPVVGAPGLPADEQQARVRQNMPFSTGSAAEGPRTYFDNPFSRSGR